MDCICDEESPDRSSEYLKKTLRTLLNKLIEAVKKLPETDCWMCGQGNANAFQICAKDVETQSDTPPGPQLRVPAPKTCSELIRVPPCGEIKTPPCTPTNVSPSPKSSRQIPPKPSKEKPTEPTRVPSLESTSRELPPKPLKSSPQPSSAIGRDSIEASTYSKDPTSQLTEHQQQTSPSLRRALQEETQLSPDVSEQSQGVSTEFADDSSLSLPPTAMATDSETIPARKPATTERVMTKTEKVLNTQYFEEPLEDNTVTSQHVSENEKEIEQQSVKEETLVKHDAQTDQLSGVSSETVSVSEHQEASQYGDRLSETDRDLLLKMEDLGTRLQKFEDMNKRKRGSEFPESSDSNESPQSTITNNFREVNMSDIFKESFFSCDSFEEKMLGLDSAQFGSFIISMEEEEKKILPCTPRVGGTEPISMECQFKMYQSKEILPGNNINNRVNHTCKTQMHCKYKSPKHFAPNKKNLCEQRLKGIIYDLIEFSLLRGKKMLDDKTSQDSTENLTCSEDTLFLENHQFFANVLIQTVEQILTFDCDMRLKEKSDQVIFVISQAIGSVAQEEFEPLIHEVIQEVEKLICQICKSHENVLDQCHKCKDTENHPDDVLKHCKSFQRYTDRNQKETGSENTDNPNDTNIGIIPTGNIMNEDKRNPTQLSQDTMKGMTFKQLQFHSEIWLQEFKEYCELFNRQANFVIRNDLLLSVNREKIEFLKRMLEKCYYGIEYLDRLMREKESFENECLATHCLYLNTEIQGISDREILYKSILEMKHNLEESAHQTELVNEYIKERFDYSPV